MSRTQDAWRKLEPQRSAPKSNGSDCEATQVVTGTEPIVFALRPDGGESGPGAVESAIPRFRPARWAPDSRTMLFLDSGDQTPGKEEFRSLRSRLHQLQEKAPIKTILVTSALPKEGRSFVAANLAQAMAQQGRRTLLVDADLRSPSLHLALGTSNTPGLSEYLLGEVEESGMVQQGQIENFFFVPAGRQISTQSEIISSAVLKALFERLAGFFDWVIVDSPAALPVSDAGLIASYCDGILMVVRSNSTPFDVVRKVVRSFQEERILGVVLNGVSANLRTQNAYYAASASTPNPNGNWV